MKNAFLPPKLFSDSGSFACVITGVHIYKSLGPLKQAFDFSDESMHEQFYSEVVHDLQIPHRVKRKKIQGN